MGVEIRSDQDADRPVMDYPIERVDITTLIPHEQTIEKELEWFINSAQESEELIWPLLIGNRNHTILDGHHRAAGLTLLGYNYVPAILIDYYDDELIKLDTWYPNLDQDVDSIISELSKFDLSISEVSPDIYSREKLNDRKITAFVGSKEKLFQVTGDRETIFKVVRDNWINKATYYDNADMCIDNTDKNKTAIISWSYTKEEILEHVKQGIVHLPKTTRHTLKYRVPKTHFPLENLK